MQETADWHETLSSDSPDPDGAMVGWMLQATPFHDSASGPVAPVPTAVQAVAEVHDTADSSRFTVLVGF
jgi:hypothetical protein